MSHDRILQSIISASLSNKEQADKVFAFITEPTLADQFSRAIKDYSEALVPGEPLGVYRVKLNAAERIELNERLQNESPRVRQEAQQAVLKDVLTSHLTGTDINILKELLGLLSKDSSLSKRLMDYAHTEEEPLATTSHDKRRIIVSSLQRAGLLPAIQYMICDALLTGGLGCAAVRTCTTGNQLALKNTAEFIQDLAPIIQNMGVEWEDFFVFATPAVVLHRSVLQMATELDNPAILLTVLGTPTFNAEDIATEKDNFKQTLRDYVAENKKVEIQRVMQKHTIEDNRRRHKAEALQAKKLFSNTMRVNSPTPPRSDSPSLTRRNSAPSLFRSQSSLCPATPNLDDTAIGFFVMAVSRVENATTIFLKNNPQTKKNLFMVYPHPALSLNYNSLGILETLPKAAPIVVLTLAINFLITFHNIYSKLWNDALRKVLSEPAILESFAVVATHILQVHRQNPVVANNAKAFLELKALGHPLHPAIIKPTGKKIA